jgi:long-chain acyl-CoA synthetase
VKTLNEMLSIVTEQNPKRIAIVDEGRAISYAELRQYIACLVEELRRVGTRPGDRVALLLPNGLAFVKSYFSIVALGAVAVPLNDHYQQSELRSFLEISGVSLLLTSQDLAPLCRQVLAERQEACGLFLVGHTEDASGLDPNSVANGGLAIGAETPVMHQFSSGTTGKPKRIARTHANLLFELDSLIQTLRITNEDRFLGVTPFSHVNGLMRSMMASLRGGATLYPAARFDRHVVVETIEKQRISVFIGVPFMFGVMAKTNYGRQPDFSSLRLCISASAPMPAALNRQFHEKFGIYVRQLYGSSETGTISVNLSDEIDESLESVGRPIAGVNVEIYSDDGEVTSAKEVGEIAVKSEAAIPSYGSEDLDKGTFRNGYFFTGDLGRKDQNGLLFLVGRKKLFINKGGYKINPREVEDLLESHPKIEEAIVIGVATPFGDEKVKAVLVTNAACAQEEVIDFCRGKISDFKIPSLIEFTEAFPKSPTGKVRRELLR